MIASKKSWTNTYFVSFEYSRDFRYQWIIRIGITQEGANWQQHWKFKKGEIRIFHVISSLVLVSTVNTDKKASVESSTQPSRPRNIKLGHRPLKNAFFDLKPGRKKRKTSKFGKSLLIIPRLVWLTQQMFSIQFYFKNSHLFKIKLLDFFPKKYLWVRLGYFWLPGKSATFAKASFNILLQGWITPFLYFIASFSLSIKNHFSKDFRTCLCKLFVKSTCNNLQNKNKLLLRFDEFFPEFWIYPLRLWVLVTTGIWGYLSRCSHWS